MALRPSPTAARSTSKRRSRGAAAEDAAPAPEGDANTPTGTGNDPPESEDVAGTEETTDGPPGPTEQVGDTGLDPVRQAGDDDEDDDDLLGGADSRLPPLPPEPVKRATGRYKALSVLRHGERGIAPGEYIPPSAFSQHELDRLVEQGAAEAEKR